MGDAAANTEITRLHYQKVSGALKLLDWQVKSHFGDESINKLFPVESTTSSLLVNLIDAAADGEQDFYDLCDGLGGAWGSAWGGLSGADATAVKEGLWMIFRDKAPSW
jgi:hypothetical protein